MSSYQEPRLAGIGPRRLSLMGALMRAPPAWPAVALGQPGIRFFAIGFAPLDGPPGTIGDPITPEFNSELECWEVVVPTGVEVYLDLQPSGWVGVPDVNDIAVLEAEPVMRTWDEDVVHITGCEITPAATFELHPMRGDGTFLPPIAIQTTP